MWTTLVLACSPDLPPDQDELVRLVRPYVDRDRPTPAVGDWPASDARPLDTWVWVGPSAGADAPDRPLLLMLHGMGGHPEKFERFARSLAADGVVVAAPTFPVSNAHADGGLASVDDLVGQIGDASFVLDQLVADVADPDSPLWMRFDPERVVGLGHSMGGATLLGRTRYDAEPRLRGEVYVCAATILEPVLASSLGATLDPGGPPTLVVTGSEDPVVPPEFGEALFDTIEEPKMYLGITGADHSNALESQDDPPIPQQQALIDGVRAAVEVAVGDGGWEVVGEDLAARGNDVR